MNSNFYERIMRKDITIGILGLGYVGVNLAKVTTIYGLKTVGFDINDAIINTFRQKKWKNFKATNDFKQLRKCDVICICVPTPIKKRKPDLTFVKVASEQIAKYSKGPSLVILESSVAPGTTRNLVLPILQSRGKIVGKDFFLAHSPERIDPGNENFNIRNTPKIIAGIDEVSLLLTKAFYEFFVNEIVVVSSLEVAELSKMLENTYRLVNISLVNEISDFAKSIGIDIWEVIKASSTKPFGFTPHYPGPGAGGHCIPVDPYYLVESAEKAGINLKLVKQAIRINETRPKKILKRAIEIAEKKKNGENRSLRLMLLGLSYKPNIADLRESPALKIWNLASKIGAQINYHDPLVPKFNSHKSAQLTKKLLDSQDIIILLTNHDVLAYEKLLKTNTPILDTRNALNGSPQINKI